MSSASKSPSTARERLSVLSGRPVAPASAASSASADSMSSSSVRTQPRARGEVPFESGVVVARETRRHTRRDAARVAHIATLDAVQEGNGRPYFLVTQGSTFNVGDGGLGMRVDNAIECGTRVLVDLSLAGGQVVECSARVVWVSEDGEGTQFVGLSFGRERPGLSELV
jgi:hypothetical protein